MPLFRVYREQRVVIARADWSLVEAPTEDAAREQVQATPAGQVPVTAPSSQHALYRYNPVFSSYNRDIGPLETGKTVVRVLPCDDYGWPLASPDELAKLEGRVK